MRRLLVLMAVSLGLASAYLKSFEVDPTHYSLSGTVNGDPQYGGVSETFIANFDSAAEVDFFVGNFDGLSPMCNVDIYDPSNNVVIASSHNVTAWKGYTWLQFPMTQSYGRKFVRGIPGT